MQRKYVCSGSAISSLMSLVAAAMMAGCAEGSANPEENLVEADATSAAPQEAQASEEAPATVQQGLSGDSSRSDFVKSQQLNSGLWGSWTSTRYCPPNTRVVGYRMRVEGGQGSGDDTALNAVELRCMDDYGNLSKVSAHDGLYGSWGDWAFCANGSVVVGGTVRFEGNRGGGDDTAANNLKVRCSDNKEVQASNGMNYGSWLSEATCPSNSSVCGIKVMFEGNRGSGDDTALNAVEFACCSDNVRKTRLSVSEYTDSNVRARTFSPDNNASRAPLIFVEGFDINGKTDLDALNSQLPWMMLDNLTRRGYSVTVVDLPQNWDSIAKNARRVGDLANRIWASSSKEHPIKLVGASMGGLIVATTAAMKDYWSDLGESNPRWTFNVDHISTIDTPHAGAYIPQAIYNTSSRFQSLRDSAKDIYSAFSSQAAQQMMMIPFSSDVQSTHDAWQTYYTKVKTALRKSGVMFVGYADGSWTGEPQYSDWTSGTQNLGWEYRSTPVDFDLWAYTQPSPGGKVARIKADWFAVGSDEDKTYYSISGNYPVVENSSGGSLNLWSQLASALGGTTAKFANVSFVPTWSAAGLAMEDYVKLPADQQKSMAALEAAQGPVAHSRFSPLTKVVALNNGMSNAPHTAVYYDDSIDLELFAAFDYSWSAWINRDQPSGNGDGEHRALMTGIPCDQPFAVQCRRASDKLDSSLTGEIVRCNLDGAECINAKQPDGRCDDYEVRFACATPTNIRVNSRVW